MPCTGIRFHLCTVCQQGAGFPGGLQQSRWKMEEWRGMEGDRGEVGGYHSSSGSVSRRQQRVEGRQRCQECRQGAPLAHCLRPCLTPQPHEEPTCEEECILTSPASSSRGLSHSPQEASARPLLLHLRYRMGPLSSPLHIHTSAAGRQAGRQQQQQHSTSPNTAAFPPCLPASACLSASYPSPGPERSS